MALLSLQNAKILVAQADLSGFSNMVEVNAEVEELDATVFGNNGYKSVVGGNKSTSIKVGGFWDALDTTYPDERLFTDLGTTGQPATVTPTGAAVGDVSYFTRVMRGDFMLGGQVGQLAEFESSAMGDGTALVRGQIADNATRTATGTTTPVQLTTPTATTRVYAAIHVLSKSGTATPTITATLQGDTAVGFPSPATVATSAGITSIGGTWLAGSLGVTSDNWYRLSYVISGTNPSFVVIASIGIGA